MAAWQLKLDMVGAAPDPSKLPNGWPSELELPRGGALVAGDANAAFGFFLTFVFFMLRMLSLPLQPLVSMLTFNESVAEDAAGVASAEVPSASGGRGEAADAPAPSTDGGALASDEPGGAV